MSDRRKLQEEINKLNELYQDYDLQLSKAGADIQQRQKLRDLMNSKKDALIAQYGDDLQKLNKGMSATISGGTISKAAKDVAGEGFDAAKKVGILKAIGKKAAGIIPFAGAGMAALQGDPAMAAEEALKDSADTMAPALLSKIGASAIAPQVGIGLAAADALLPEVAGNQEEEKMMLAERAAQESYKKSPARMAKLQAMIGRGPASTPEVEQAKEQIKEAAPLPGFSSDIPASKFDEERRKQLEKRNQLERMLGKQKL